MKRTLIQIEQFAKEINSKSDWNKFVADDTISSVSKLELYTYLKHNKPEVIN